MAGDSAAIGERPAAEIAREHRLFGQLEANHREDLWIDDALACKSRHTAQRDIWA